MNSVWKTLIEIENLLESQFNISGQEIEEPNMLRFNRPNWINKVWSGQRYRRAHIDVVDARDTKGLWMMHCCIFPHTHNSGPIFGFDVIAGKNKITGCFHDFSPTLAKDHIMIDWFTKIVDQYSWKKERPLPNWATPIFSSSMIAAGNVTNNEELSQILEIAYITTDYYIKNIGLYNHTCNSSADQQNFYCDQQRKNPHTPKVMANLGLDPSDIGIFIEECLFPNIPQTN